MNFQFDICVMYSLVWSLSLQQPYEIINTTHPHLVYVGRGTPSTAAYRFAGNVMLCYVCVTSHMVFHLSVLVSDE